MNVLIVCGVNYIGGAEEALVRVLPPLLAQNCSARIAVLAPSGGQLEPYLRTSGVEVDVLPVVRARHLAQSCAAAIRLAWMARNADVIHANDTRAALWCQAAALLARRPWVWHVRDLLHGGHRFERVGRALRPTRMIAISGAVKRQLLTFGPWQPDRVDVVNHGVDADALASAADRGAWRAEMGLPDDVVAIGIVGRLVAWKGQDEFLRAAAIVAGRRNDVHFFVVGEQVTDRYTAAHMGDERQRLEQLADQLEVRERVTFTGWCRDVPSMMAGLDLLVLASHAEPFGLVLLEAMSQGTAVIATTGGGPEDVVTHDTGVLVPPRNPEALAAALMRTVANPRLRRKMGQAARKRVRANFCLENEAVGILATWTRALHHARQSVCVSA